MGEPSTTRRLGRGGIAAAALALAAVALSQTAGAMTRGPAASLSSCGDLEAAVFGKVAAGLGSVTPEKACVAELPADVQLMATPAKGYVLEGWSGCMSTDGNICIVHVEKFIDYTASATFVRRDANQAPTASIAAIDPNPAHVGDKVAFDGDGKDPEGGALTFAWSFGDGGQSSGSRVTHAYRAPGTFGVTLTATDPQGATGTDSASVSVINDPPSAAIDSASPNPAKIGETVSFAASGGDPEGFGVTYAWDFGDGSQGSGQTAAHAYASSGSFPVTLTVTDPHGGSAKASVSVSVQGPGNQAPSASITSAQPNPAQIGQTVSFTGKGSDPEGGALRYAWDFGDGGRADGPAGSHAYTASGTYEVTLTVTDPQNASANASVSVLVQGAGNRAPTASIVSASPNPAQVGQAVAFTGDGNDPDGGTVTYAWSFGDGTRADGQRATHAYAAPGVYAVTLTATDAVGASATARADVRIDPVGGETGIVVGDLGGPPEKDSFPPPAASLALETSGAGSIVAEGTSALRLPQSSGAPRLACGVRGFRCFADFPVGRSVQLRAIAARGFALARWSGACSGTDGSTCTVALGKDRTVGAVFVARSRAGAQVSVRRPRVRVRWRQSVGRGELVVSGWVSRKAAVRAQLRRPAGGPLVTRVATVRAGRFTLRRKLGPGLLPRGATVLPGAFVVSLTGRSAGLPLPLQVRTVELPAPREGVTRRAFASASESGPPAKFVAGGGEAWAHFVFAAQPWAGSKLAVTWYAPDGTPIGTAPKGNRPTVDSFIRCECPLRPGDFVAELRAGSRIIKRLLVRVR